MRGLSLGTKTFRLWSGKGFQQALFALKTPSFGAHSLLEMQQCFCKNQSLFVSLSLPEKRQEVATEHPCLVSK